MAWHISNKLYEKWRYSQVPEEASLAESSSDGNASVQLSGNPTPLLYLPPDRMKAFSRLSRYGMTFRPLTEDHGAALLTWYREASLVRTSAPQERERASPESAAECGSTWRGSLARYDRSTSSWRTAQYSLLGDLTLYSGTWPRWGTMRNGECSERSMPGHLTRENVSGLWPTPTKQDAKHREVEPCYKNGTAKYGAIPLHVKVGGELNVDWVEWLMGWPTGWTALVAQETDKFQQWCASHGIPFTNGYQSA